MDVDLIGKFFSTPPFLLNPKKKDVRVDTEHPLLHALLLQMRHSHIRRYVVRFLGYRAKKVCSGT